jgi:hypothetical protein
MDLKLSPEYTAFREECRRVGADFGINEWTVEMACLLRGYDPRKAGLVVETRWPEVRVITEASDALFVDWLQYEAWQLGLSVVWRREGVDNPVFRAPFPTEPEEPLTAVHKPPRAQAFYVRVETSPLVPPDVAAELHRQIQQAGRELLRRLGYRVPKRFRRSQLMQKAKRLRVDKEKLNRRETGDIAEAIYGEGAGSDKRLKRTVKDQRYKARRRIERDYSAD